MVGPTAVQRAVYWVGVSVDKKVEMWADEMADMKAVAMAEPWVA